MRYEALSQLVEPPIFVVGVHRSGTTWTYDMLTAHPAVAGVFESGIFSLDLGLAPLFHPAHWYEAEAQKRDREFFGKPFRLGQLIDRERLLAEIGEMSSAWLASALGPNDRYLVEKTPQHARTIALIGEIYPGAHVLHVIRDGRDVAVSNRAAVRSWPGQVRSRSIPHVARNWADTIRLARSQAGQSDVCYREVRYERLRHEPAKVLSEIFAWAQIPADASMVHRIVTATSLEAQEHGPRGFRRAGRIGDWKTELSPRDRWRFERAGGQMLAELGYDSSIPRWVRKLRTRAPGK